MSGGDVVPGTVMDVLRNAPMGARLWLMQNLKDQARDQLHRNVASEYTPAADAQSTTAYQGTFQRLLKELPGPGRRSNATGVGALDAESAENTNIAGVRDAINQQGVALASLLSSIGGKTRRTRVKRGKRSKRRVASSSSLAAKKYKKRKARASSLRQYSGHGKKQTRVKFARR